MQINIKYDRIFITTVEESDLRCKVDYFRSNKRPLIKDQDMNEVEERILEAFIFCNFSENSKDDLLLLKGVIQKLYRGVTILNDDIVEDLEGLYYGYLQTMILFAEEYLKFLVKRRTIIDDEIKPDNFGRSICSDIAICPVVSEFPFEGLNEDRSSEKILYRPSNQFLSQASALNDFGTSLDFAQCYDRSYRLMGNECFPRRLYLFRSCYQLLVHLIVRQLGEDYYNLFRFVNKSYFYSVWLFERDRRRDYLLSEFRLGDSVVREIDHFSFRIPRTDMWYGNSRISRFYCFDHNYLWCSCTLRYRWIDVEASLKSLIGSRIRRYVSLVGLDTKHDLVYYLSIIRERMYKKSLTIEFNDIWLYELIKFYGKLSYSLTSMFVCESVIRFVTMLWLCGWRNGWMVREDRVDVLKTLATISGLSVDLEVANSIGAFSLSFAH